MSYSETNKKETVLESVKNAVPMRFRIALLLVLLVIILLLFLRSCGGDGFEDDITITEQVNDMQKLVNEKIDRIKQLKEAGNIDKALISELETEVTGLKTVLDEVQDELDNMNTTSTVQTQQARKKALDAIQKVNAWDSKTEKQIAQVSGQAIKSIKDSLRTLDSQYLAQLEAKNEEIAKLKRELQTIKTNTKNESDEIKTLNARIKALEQQVQALTVENGRLKAENLELKASAATNKGDAALVAMLSQDLDAQRRENQKISTLTNKLEKIESVVNKNGGLQVYYVDKHKRKIELDDTNRSRDIKDIVINYTNTNYEQADVSINVLTTDGIELQNLKCSGSIINYMLSSPCELEVNKKTLPRGDYKIQIKNNDKLLDELYFTVQRSF